MRASGLPADTLRAPRAAPALPDADYRQEDAHDAEQGMTDAAG